MHDLENTRICFIAGTLGHGGAERQLFYVIRALRELNANVRVLCLADGEFWKPSIARLDVEVRSVGLERTRLGRLARMMREVARFRPAIVQSQHFYTNLYAVLIARLSRARELGAIRCDVTSEIADTGSLGGMCLRLPRLLVANSRAAIATARKHGVPAERLSFLPNVVETDRFRPREAAARDRFRVFGIGRLAPQKRFDRFIGIVDEMRRRSSRRIEGIIVGEGPLRSDLEQQGRDLGLIPEHLSFWGAVDDMVPVYQQADAVVVTSDYEGTPNVILEAMASGVPVISARVGGVADLICHDRTGYLADPADDAAMVDALVELAASEGLSRQIGGAAREYVISHHAVAGLSGRLAAIYGAARS